jgi:hypothetical protein
LKALGEPPLPLFAAAEGAGAAVWNLGRDSAAEASEKRAMALLPEMPLGKHVVEDYATLSLTLKRHPLAFGAPISPVKVWSPPPISLTCRSTVGWQSPALC